MAETELQGHRRGAKSGKADALVVFLHGYGADAADLMGLAEPLSGVLPNAAFAAPNAPQRSALNPMGYQWFPLPWIDGSSEAEMRAGFETAERALTAYLARELTHLGLGQRRLALVGFSQGCMMALQVGPTLEPGPAAIIGYSGRLADPERLKARKRSSPPVYLSHGALDDVVAPASLEEARVGLAALGLSVETHMSPHIGHSISEEGLRGGAMFLRGALMGG